MRRWLFVVAFAGCTHAASTTPAWPKQHTAADDGGESLAPREAAKSISVALESDDADKPAEKPADKPADKPAAAVTEGGAAATNATAPTDDVITTEEIVIEVGPDD